VRLRDVRGRSGADFVYRLVIRERQEDFRVSIDPEHPNVPRGGVLPVNVTVERLDDFNGPIEVRLEGLPAGFAASTTTLGPNLMSGVIQLAALPGVETPSLESSLTWRAVATARVRGEQVERRSTPALGAHVLTVTSPPDLVVTVAHPLYHKNAMLGTKGALLQGGRIVMMERFDPARFVAVIDRYRVTKVHTVPTMMARILADPALLGGCSQDSIQEVHMGSAPVSQRLFDEVRAAFPRAYVRVSYGVTEAGPMQFGEHPRGLARPPLSIGYPLPDVQLRLVGGETADQGVLHIRSPGMMMGYDGRPEETRARFSSDGWYITGDVLRRDADGFFHFVGRDDDMFTVGGYNLYPATVEATLLKHPDVQQVAVVALEDEVRGHVPIAFVRARAGTSPDERVLQRFALEHAPAHEYPRRVFLVDELPLAGTGKIDYRGLRERARLLVRAGGD
jgi:acyl-CoA synthetase (AMP-forming)/AMP-acid ligase II